MNIKIGGCSMNLRYFFLVFVLIFAFFSHGFSNEPNYSDEFKTVSVDIDGKSYYIKCKIIPRRCLNESAEYIIRDDENDNFTVSGYRSGPRGHKMWNIFEDIFDIEDELGANGILHDIYHKNVKDKNSRISIYEDIFWQIYEKVGVSENNYPY